MLGGACFLFNSIVFLNEIILLILTNIINQLKLTNLI